MYLLLGLIDGTKPDAGLDPPPSHHPFKAGEAEAHVAKELHGNTTSRETIKASPVNIPPPQRSKTSDARLILLVSPPPLQK